jgi:hypothetical protein
MKKNNKWIIITILLLIILFIVLLNKVKENLSNYEFKDQTSYIITWNGKVLCDIGDNQFRARFLDPYDSRIRNDRDRYKWKLEKNMVTTLNNPFGNSQPIISNASTNKYYIRNIRTSFYLSFNPGIYSYKNNNYDQLCLTNKEAKDEFIITVLDDKTERFKIEAINYIGINYIGHNLYNFKATDDVANSETYFIVRNKDTSIPEYQKMYFRFIKIS